MGADFISLEFDGKLSKEDIRKELDKQRERDSEYNGHQEGYSGDWQTIDNKSIIFTDIKFNSYDDAHNYVADNCEKWSGMAVKYKEIKQSDVTKHPEYKKITKRQKQLEKLGLKVTAITNKQVDKIHTKEFAKCVNCNSKVNIKYVRTHTCCVCGNSLISASVRTKIDAINNERGLLQKDIEQIQKNIESQLKGEEKWLVGAWASC